MLHPSHSAIAHAAVDHPQQSATDIPVLRRADSPLRVLIAEDDPALAATMSAALRYEGWSVACAEHGGAAIRKVQDNPPDLIVLDMTLPDASCLAILVRLHEVCPGLPVLLLRDRVALTDRSAGLHAVESLTKPFGMEELILHLHALARRSGLYADAGTAQLIVGDLVLDRDSREVTRSGTEIILTATEFKLLHFMMRNSRRVLTKPHILERVWDHSIDRHSNIVELYISYLRRKVDDGRAPMIHTLRGAGYVLKAGF